MTDATRWIMGGPLGVLLIHGLGGTPSEMAPLAKALGDAGHTICSVRLSGHGTGATDLAKSSAHDWRDSALAAHARVSQRCARVVVVGLSMGALLALDIAQTRSERVHGLVLLSPALRLDGWAMPHVARFAGLLPPCLVPVGLSIAERHPYGIKDQRIRAIVLSAMRNGASGGHFNTPLRALIAFRSIAARVSRHLSDVGQPTLIVHPRDDDMASLSNAQEIAARLRGLTDMLVLDDSYHLVTIDRQRQLVQERVKAFVAGIAMVGRSTCSSGDSPRPASRARSLHPICAAGRPPGDVP